MGAPDVDVVLVSSHARCRGTDERAEKVARKEVDLRRHGGDVGANASVEFFQFLRSLPFQTYDVNLNSAYTLYPVKEIYRKKLPGPAKLGQLFGGSFENAEFAGRIQRKPWCPSTHDSWSALAHIYRKFLLLVSLRVEALKEKDRETRRHRNHGNLLGSRGSYAAAFPGPFLLVLRGTGPEAKDRNERNQCVPISGLAPTIQRAMD
uniref:Uncharacterized protein n=1 Tax=Oryza brachyantha TaxID=4533 RepID=J3M4W2_ORYBR